MSERFRQFGRQALVGDLAIRKECEHLIEAPEEEAGEADNEEEETAQQPN